MRRRAVAAVAALVGLGLLLFLGLVSLSAAGAGVWLLLGTERDIVAEPIGSAQELFENYRTIENDSDEDDSLADADEATEDGWPARRSSSRRSQGGNARPGVGTGSGRSGSGAGRGGRGSGEGGRGGRGSDDDDDDKGSDDKGSDDKGSDDKGSDDDDSCSHIKGVTRISSTRYEVTDAFVDKYLRDADRAQRQGKGYWHEDKSGDVDGVKIKSLKCAPLVAGLQNKDIVHELNGKKITGVLNAWSAYKKAKKADTIKIKLRRSGEKMTIRYDVK